MAAIALFGNFGPLQFLLVVVGLPLLQEADLPPPPGARGDAAAQTAGGAAVPASGGRVGAGGLDLDSAVTTIALALAAAAAVWTLHDVRASCAATWQAEPLVWSAICLAVLAVAAEVASGRMGRGEAATAAVLLAGSAAPLASGLIETPLPWESLLDRLNIGASPYGLFAVMTGVGGRPVALIEAAEALDGPWLPVPLRYQVNEPSAPLPLCWPHFPRMDWALWFVPLGQTDGLWITRLLRGIANGDPGVLSLLDEPAFAARFASPPNFARLSIETYTLEASGRWAVSGDGTDGLRSVVTTVARALLPFSSDWPSTPLRLALAPGGLGLSPEQFIWGWFAVAEAVRRAAPEPEGAASALGLDVPDVLALLRLRGES